jgi:DNA-binding transcriptional LysR family regulator
VRLAKAQLTVELLFDEPLIVALPKSHRLVRERRHRLPALESLRDDAFGLHGPSGTGCDDETVRAGAHVAVHVLQRGRRPTARSQLSS